MSAGVPSHLYLRLLRGEVNAARYCAVVRRAVRMRSRLGRRERWVVRALERGRS